MAYFNPSNLQNGMGIFTEQMQSAEWRLPDNAALKVIRNTEIMNPPVAQLQTTQGRTVNGYMPIRSAEGSGTTITHNFTGDKGDSAATTIEYSLLSETFSISKKQAENNIFSWPEMFAATLRDRVLSLINRLDPALVALLKAGRSGYSAGGGRGTFEEDNDVYEVSYPSTIMDDGHYLFTQARALMEFNRYQGNYMAICDSALYSDVLKLMPQGSSNATNYSAQFQGFDVVPTTRTIMGDDWDCSMLVFKPEMVAMFPWMPVANRKPLNAEEALNSYILTYGQIDVEGLPFPIAITARSDNSDQSSYGGQAQDVVTYFQIFIYYGFLVSPVSSLLSSVETPIFAVARNKDTG